MKQQSRRKEIPQQTVQEAPPEIAKRDRILTEAARLFALEGFHGASMRDIAKAADVGLPLVVYHFETKQNLYRSIFEHHRHLLDERLSELRSALKDPGPYLIDRVASAFIGPALRIQRTPEGIVYSQLIAREVSEPGDDTRGIMSEYFDPVAREFIDALRVALPDKVPGYVEWGYLFMVGALVTSVFDARIPRITEGKYRPGDIERKIKFLTSFVAAGLRGGPESDPPAKRRKGKSPIG